MPPLEPHFHDGSAVLTQSPILETLFDPSLFDWDSARNAAVRRCAVRARQTSFALLWRSQHSARFDVRVRNVLLSDGRRKVQASASGRRFFSEERFYLASSDSASFTFSDGGFDRGVNMSGGLLASPTRRSRQCAVPRPCFVEELLKKLPGELMRLPTKELREDATLIPIVLRSNPLLASCFSITQLMQNRRHVR